MKNQRPYKSPPKRITPTPEERRALVAIGQWIRKKGYSPSYREIGAELDRSEARVWEFVGSLVLKGYLTHKKDTGRTTVVTTAGWREIDSLPLVKVEDVCSLRH